jgi:hypothetical protein
MYTLTVPLLVMQYATWTPWAIITFVAKNSIEKSTILIEFSLTKDFKID